MKEKFYKGMKIKNIQPFDPENSSGILHGQMVVLKNSVLKDSKEESLKEWKPTLLQDVLKYHYLKFGKQDFMIQLDKLEEEVKELLDAIQRVKSNKEICDQNTFDTLMDYVQDEYGDVIMAGCELLDLQKTMEHTFDKLALRIYPDGYRHIED